MLFDGGERKMENEIKKWILKKAIEFVESFIEDISFISDDHKFKITKFLIQRMRDVLDLHEEEVIFSFKNHH